MGRTFLFIMAALGLFSAMAGRSPQRSIPDGTHYRSADGSDSSSSGARDPSDLLDEDAVTLERNSDGHFYADVEINGSTVHMLVDTGAGGIALSREDARSAGIATSIGMNEVVGEGADGAVYGEQIRIDRMRLGVTTAEGVDAVVLNSGGMSLLGQDFLRRFQSVEIKDDQMILR